MCRVSTSRLASLIDLADGAELGRCFIVYSHYCLSTGRGLLRFSSLFHYKLIKSHNDKPICTVIVVLHMSVVNTALSTPGYSAAIPRSFWKKILAVSSWDKYNWTTGNTRLLGWQLDRKYSKCVAQQCARAAAARFGQLPTPAPRNSAIIHF